MRRTAEGWELAVIEPQREAWIAGESDKKRHKEVLALPKGLIDPGEKPAQTAVREVREETGLTGSILAKLTDIKYTYVRTWGDKQKVFKIVSFYLLKHESGTINDVSTAMRIEVKRAQWIPLEGAERRLAYRGERDVIRVAREYLKSHIEEGQS